MSAQRIGLVFVCWLLVLGIGESDAYAADIPVQNVWVQVVPPGTGMLRAVTTAGSCPIADFDGKPQRMRVRAAPDSSYEVLTCELAVPADAKSIRVADRSLKPLTQNPRRIAVIGDTGCRMKAGHAFDDGFQNCGDANDWEFAKVARQVAAWEPDLIIQLGDYVYREQPCPIGCGNCQGSPWNHPGMRMDTWNAEFFEPGKPMLEAAPVVLVRGDHEKCERAGGGFFRFLDGREFQACSDFTDPYALNFENLQLVIMDTVQAQDTERSPDAVIARYAADFERAARLAKGNTWLMTHRPIWAYRPAADIEGDPVQDVCGNYVEEPPLKLDEINMTTQEALRASSLKGALPPEIELVLASHAHVGEVLGFAGTRAPQVIVGISGTKLLPAVPSGDLVGRTLDGEQVSDALVFSTHGFFGFEYTPGEGWGSSVIDGDGQEVARCAYDSRQAECLGPRP